MSKQLLNDEEIYLAPGIRGIIEHGNPRVVDETRNLELDPTQFLDQVSIYEREVEGWFLGPARRMLQEDSFSNSFIVLMVCMAYIEGVEQYKSGESSNRQSQSFFIKSIESVYGNRFTKANLKKLYNKTRCGLFHNGMVKGGVIFSNNFESVIEFRNGSNDIRINPTALLSDLRRDFDNFIEALKIADENSELRQNFQRMFSVLPHEH